MLDSLNPNLLAFFSAVAFAAAQTLYRGALLRVSVAAVTIGVNATICLLATALFLASGDAPRWHPMGIFVFVMVGFFGAYLGRYLNYLSINYIGLPRTHVLTQTQPVWSALLAVALLGESVRAGTGLGTAAIVGGSVLLVRERRAGAEPVPLRRYLLPVFTAFLFGFTPTLRKIGFGYIPAPTLALAIAMGTGVLFQIAASLLAGRREALRWDGGSLSVILAGGVLNALAALCLWTAIKYGDLVELVPISRLSVLFVLLFSWMFYRKLERIGWQVVAGALLAVAGTAAIAGSR